MKRLTFLFAALFLTLCSTVPLRAADAPVAPDSIGPYAVVVSKTTSEDPEWAKVVAALVAKHQAKVIVYEGDVRAALPALKKLMPRFAAFVGKPAEVGRSFVVAVHRLTRDLNDDPYGDVVWGIVTGYKPADALRIATATTPLVIRRAGSGTDQLPLEPFTEAQKFSEGQAGAQWIKTADGKVVQNKIDADSTRDVVKMFNEFKPDFFMTSGHASERDWQMGYSYPNGSFRCKDGILYGVDTKRHAYKIDSPNPKVYLPPGNCLIGHIPDEQSMALAFMGSAGVDQMIGYVVSTWYGRGGWGTRDYFFAMPGHYDLAQSFYFNNQTIIHELETKFPKSARFNIDKFNIETDPQVIGKIAGAIGYTQNKPELKDNVGLLWDRDTVALYGDPAWDARLASKTETLETQITAAAGVYTLTIKALADTTPGPPFALLLPHRLRHPAVQSGSEFDPLITSNFIMLFKLPAKLEAGKTYTVTFKAEPY